VGVESPANKWVLARGRRVGVESPAKKWVLA
jgi:hypothetical protein